MARLTAGGVPRLALLANDVDARDAIKEVAARSPGASPARRPPVVRDGALTAAAMRSHVRSVTNSLRRMRVRQTRASGGTPEGRLT